MHSTSVPQVFPGEQAGERAGRIAWRQSEDRSTWVAEAAGLHLAVGIPRSRAAVIAREVAAAAA